MTAAHAQNAALHPPVGFILHPAPKPLPDIRFLDEKGQVRHLADFKGHVLLLNLWASWCPGCRLEMPSLDHAQEMLAREGLMVIPISFDQKGAAITGPYFRENDIKNLPQFFDPAWEMRKSLGVESLPMTILVSRDGWELGRTNVWLNWSTPASVMFLRSVLQTP